MTRHNEKVTLPIADSLPQENMYGGVAGETAYVYIINIYLPYTAFKKWQWQALCLAPETKQALRHPGA